MDDLLIKLSQDNGNGMTDPFHIVETKVEKYHIHDVDTYRRMRKPKVGDLFVDIEQLKECLTYYALAKGFSLWFYRSSKTKLIAKWETTIKDQYGYIRSYAKAILESNPCSTIKVMVTVNPDAKTYFDRFYVCFKGLKDGWILGCRMIIALDGCFHKRPSVGEILTDIGRDANNHIFPVAWREQRQLQLVSRFTRMHIMRNLCDKWTVDICPNIQKRLEITKDQHRFWHVIPTGGNLFEVRNGSEAFGIDEERRNCAASEWFKKDCIGSVTTWEDLVEKFVQKFYKLSDNNEEMETDKDDDPNDIADIFKIEGNLFDFETPLCKAFNEFNYLLKIDMDLFTFDIKGIKTYEEYELNNNLTGDLKEPWSDNRVPYQLCDHICKPYRFKNGKTKWPTCSSYVDGFCNGGELPGMDRVGCMTYFQDHKWYGELTDGKMKEEALMHKARFEESWGDATLGVMKLCAWLKNSFENFHELDYDVLVKLEECWWKVNAHENASFTCWENHGHGPKKAGNTQDNLEYKKEHHDPSVGNVRRFEMKKYSFNADDEYVAIKEHEHSDHSRTNVDARQAYRELFRIMDEGWPVTKTKE
ncbi:hypothetical protein Tco_0511103 [Tanacetum coccineum]